MIHHPKPYLDGFRLRHHAYGVERRRNMSKLILERGTEFPKPLGYEDIDEAVQDWVKSLGITYEGKELPTYKLYSNQRMSEYSQSWQNLDESGNLVTSFKTVTRENNPKQGKIYDDSFNIPGNRKYPMFIVPVLQENGTEAYDMYSMAQPMAVDFSFVVGIVCVKYDLINEFNKIMLSQFKALECYIFPNGHPVSMKLNDVSDDSQYDINNRKYYSQTYKITVKAYIVEDKDYQVDRLPSRLVMRMLGTTPKISREKFVLDTVSAQTGAVTTSGEACFPYQGEADAKKHDYGDYVSVEEEYVKPEECLRKEDDHYYNKKVIISVYFDCTECSQFEIDTDVVIVSAETVNVYDFVMTVNGEKVDFENDFPLYAGDAVSVCISRDEPGEPSSVSLVGYDPNVVFDDRVNPESALDEEPDEEVIDVQ